LLATEPVDIACCTETWFEPSVLSCSIIGDLPYSVYRADRANSAYGGVCIITRDAAVKAVQVEIVETFVQTVIVAIDILNVLNPIRVICVYRSPVPETDSIALSEVKLLIKCLTKLSDVNRSVIITGDFNFPKINWNEVNLVSDSVTCSNLFISFTKQYALEQLVDNITRPSSVNKSITTGISGTIIDLVLCNDTHIVHNLNVNAPFSTSDHCVVDFQLSYLPLKGDSSHCFPVDVNYRNFNMCDWDGIRNCLYNVDWSDVFSDCATAEQHASKFYDIVNDCVERFVPLCVSPRNGRFHGTRYPPHIRKLLSKKKCAWRLYKKFGKAAYLTRYKQISSQCRKAIFCFILQREETLLSTGNLGKFYRYANSKLTSRTNVGPLRQPDGSLTIDPQVKASLLSDYFSSTFSADNGESPTLTSRTSSALTTVIFTQQSVFNVLSKLNAKSAGGPDSIPPIFLKNTRSQLSAPLAFLYQLFFDSSFVPLVWSKAYITPIFKKGDSSLPSNYRPISLTCTLCKVMESIIKDHIVLHLSFSGLLSKDQHAFIAKHSTISNLLECIHDWPLSLHHNSQGPTRCHLLRL